MAIIKWEHNKRYGLDYSTAYGICYDYTFDIRYDCDLLTSEEKPKNSCCIWLDIYYRGFRIHKNYEYSVEKLMKFSQTYLEKEIKEYFKKYGPKVTI